MYIFLEELLTDIDLYSRLKIVVQEGGENILAQPKSDQMAKHENLLFFLSILVHQELFSTPS